jgi:hypothetical protein
MRSVADSRDQSYEEDHASLLEELHLAFDPVSSVFWISEPGA